MLTYYYSLSTGGRSSGDASAVQYCAVSQEEREFDKASQKAMANKKVYGYLQPENHPPFAAWPVAKAVFGKLPC